MAVCPFNLVLYALICHLLDFRTTALLLSDIPSPAFVIDVGFLQKQLEVAAIPPLTAGNGLNIAPTPIPDIICPYTLSDSLQDPVEFLHANAQSSNRMPAFETVGLSYWHAAVVRPREEKRQYETENFLAELNLDHSTRADLCLGLNNHHVVSYYWARSAGTGASMEAPGIVLDEGCLCWESTRGPTTCNSNDGKRSEWVNFLRKGDQVQLVPKHPADDLRAWLQEDRIVYGISNKNRPLGSEPAVVCQWILSS